MARLLGRRPRVADARIKRLSVAAPSLPDPPASSNWYADIPAWQMLGNDECGDCVVAMGMHFIYQQQSYLTPGRAPMPTAAEAIASYSAIGGYTPSNPDSDQGLTVMGKGGLVEYWARDGLMCGGTNHKLTGVLQITRPNPREWQQAISMFSGLGVGIRLPESIADSDVLPFVWDDPSGPIAGGHEMFLVGYEKVSGHTFYDCITWGERVRLTEEFLVAVYDEGVCMLSTDGLDKDGKNAVGVTAVALADAMTLLKTEA